MAAIYAPGHSIPNLVLIGLPDVAAMKRALFKLKHAQIPHYVWPPRSVMSSEPEKTLGPMTAIATAPIMGEQKEVLKNYNLWKETENVATGVFGSAERNFRDSHSET